MNVSQHIRSKHCQRRLRRIFFARYVTCRQNQCVGFPHKKKTVPANLDVCDDVSRVSNVSNPTKQWLISQSSLNSPILSENRASEIISFSFSNGVRPWTSLLATFSAICWYHNALSAKNKLSNQATKHEKQRARCVAAKTECLLNVFFSFDASNSVFGLSALLFSVEKKLKHASLNQLWKQQLIYQKPLSNKENNSDRLVS